MLVITALIVVMVASALNAWVNIQIKFAPSREHAIAMYKRLLWVGLNLTIFGTTAACFLQFGYFSKEPLTRQEVARNVLLLALAAVNCGMLFTSWLVSHIYECISKLNEHVTAHAKCISHLAKDIGCEAAIREPQDKPQSTLGAAPAQTTKQLSGDGVRP